jgi:hypothetical protein
MRCGGSWDEVLVTLRTTVVHPNSINQQSKYLINDSFHSNFERFDVLKVYLDLMNKGD